MTAERWQHTLSRSVLELDPFKVKPFLAAAHAGDEALRQEGEVQFAHPFLLNQNS
jgi:hypothetical protein